MGLSKCSREYMQIVLEAANGLELKNPTDSLPNSVYLLKRAFKDESDGSDGSFERIHLCPRGI